MGIKNKIINIFFVNRAETVDKWWHRLFKVLLVASTIFIFTVTILAVIDSQNHVWVTNKPVAFSLEPNYQKVRGEEIPCEENLNFNDGDRLIIKCEGVDIPTQEAKKYKELYDAADNNLEKQFGLDKYSITKCSQPRINGKLSPEEISCVRENLDAWQADPNYSKYQEEVKKLARIKVIRDVDFGLMSRDIGMLLVTPLFCALVWFILMNSILYRIVLYIIYGNKK